MKIIANAWRSVPTSLLNHSTVVEMRGYHIGEMRSDINYTFFDVITTVKIFGDQYKVLNIMTTTFQAVCGNQ